MAISENTRKKMADASRRTQNGFKKGHPNYFKGHSEETKNKLRGENAHQWKGDKVGYGALHKWVRKHLGTPSYCAICQTTESKKFQWANVSHAYKRDLSDWIRLCPSCHKLYDLGKIKL